mgnify:CR=1 FL=1
MKKDLIITIDGPSGAGKSTVAKMLAQSLNYSYIDTGAMYRGVAYAYKVKGKGQQTEGATPLDDIEAFLKDLSIRFEFGEDARVFLDDEDVSNAIRTPDISMLASSLSQNRSVRAFLTEKQREIGANGRIVMEGRDTGSVVFPHADVKFYLDASEEERAKRRYIELSEKGIHAEISSVRKDMSKRDMDDSKREIAPLRIPHGAVIVDTTGIDAKGVTDKLLKYIEGMENNAGT